MKLPVSLSSSCPAASSQQENQDSSTSQGRSCPRAEPPGTCFTSLTHLPLSCSGPGEMLTLIPRNGVHLLCPPGPGLLLPGISLQCEQSLNRVGRGQHWALDAGVEGLSFDRLPCQMALCGDDPDNGPEGSVSLTSRPFRPKDPDPNFNPEIPQSKHREINRLVMSCPGGLSLPDAYLSSLCLPQIFRTTTK